jgi:maleamate amidohydrolase
MTASPRDDLDQNYAQAGFARPLPWGRRPAFVIVDFCLAYLEPRSPFYAKAEAARDSAVRLLAAARSAGVPVLHTTVRYQPGGIDGGVFYRKIDALRVFEVGSPLAEPPPELAPRAGEIVIVKQYASGFFGTSLASTLTSLGVDTLVITGVSASGCVRATAVDACQHGFLPFVCRDAVADRDPRPHEANLFDLQAKYAEVVSEAFVLDQFAPGRNSGQDRAAG